jgi:hypothetical protein
VEATSPAAPADPPVQGAATSPGQEAPAQGTATSPGQDTPETGHQQEAAKEATSSAAAAPDPVPPDPPPSGPEGASSTPPTEAPRPPPAERPLVECLPEGLASLKQILANYQASQAVMGGKYLHPAHNVVRFRLPRKYFINNEQCPACLVKSAPDETDPDKIHHVLCDFYEGDRVHVHDETCKSNPLCLTFYRLPSEEPDDKKDKKNKKHRK